MSKWPQQVASTTQAVQNGKTDVERKARQVAAKPVRNVNRI